LEPYKLISQLDTGFDNHPLLPQLINRVYNIAPNFCQINNLKIFFGNYSRKNNLNTATESCREVINTTPRSIPTCLDTFRVY